MTKKTRRAYTQEFKAQVVREASTGAWTQGEVARRHGIHPTLVSQWLQGRSVAAAEPDPAEERPRRKHRPRDQSVALTIAATARAVDKLNGRATAPAPGSTGVAALIKEAVSRLRGFGIELKQVTVSDDRIEVNYSVKETIET